MEGGREGELNLIMLLLMSSTLRAVLASQSSKLTFRDSFFHNSCDIASVINKKLKSVGLLECVSNNI